MSSLLWESAGSQSPLPMHKQASGPRACQRLTPPADAFVARTRTYKLQVRLKVLVKRACHNTPCALSVAYLLAVKAEKSEVTLQFRQERSAERLVQLANDLSGLHTHHGFGIALQYESLRAVYTAQKRHSSSYSAHGKWRGFFYLVQRRYRILLEASDTVLADQIRVVIKSPAKSRHEAWQTVQIWL